MATELREAPACVMNVEQLDYLRRILLSGMGSFNDFHLDAEKVVVVFRDPETPNTRCE